MICKHIELTMATTEPRDIAKAMLKFWLYQSEQARQDHSIGASKIEACECANMQAQEDWERDCDFSGGFSGPRLPFNENEIQMYKDRLPRLEAHRKEAKAMAGYMVNFITDKAHPQGDDE